MFITVDEVRDLTSFEEVMNLNNLKIEYYMDRADGWIRRATGRYDLVDSEDVQTQQDLKVASLLLVEYIWYWDQPESKEMRLSEDESVELGSFSFKRATPGDETGIDELDSILGSLTYRNKLGANVFKISHKKD